MSKDILYFPHDTNSRTDKSLQKLLMEEGVAGIGIYWSIIEMLHENNGKMDISLFKSIAFELHVECPSIERVVKNFDLFHVDEVEFWSDRVNRNLFEIKNKSTHGSIAAKARWDKERNARASKIDAHPMPLKESKVKESKVYTSPTLSEVKAYFKENGYTEASAIKAFDYYDVAKWVDSQGKKVKNWRQKMQGVWFKPENKERGKVTIQ